MCVCVCGVSGHRRRPVLGQKRRRHKGGKPGRGGTGADGFIVREPLMSIHGIKATKSAV